MAASRQSTVFPQGILLALVAALAFAAAPASAAAAELEFQFNLTVTGTVPAAETLQLFFDSTAIKSGPTVFLFCAPDVPPQPPQGPQIAPCRGNGTPSSQGHAGNPVGSVVTYRFERVTAGGAVTVLYGGTFTATHDETFNLTYLAGALPNTAAAHAAGRPDVLAVLAGLMFALGGCLVAARSRGKAT